MENVLTKNEEIPGYRARNWQDWSDWNGRYQEVRIGNCPAPPWCCGSWPTSGMREKVGNPMQFNEYGRQALAQLFALIRQSTSFGDWRQDTQRG